MPLLPPASLSIAVLTYRRPDDLRRCLPLLVEQATQARAAGLEAGVLVIDNDAAPSAQETVQVTAARAAVQVRYVHEPVPGISAARNRALDVAGSDLLVFIDDDEHPTPDWIRRLLRTREAYGADLVQGPVRSEFAATPDGWILDGGFFRRRRMPTGTLLDVAVTNNLLLDLRFVRRHGLRFDPGLGTTGGEDTLFTRRLHRAGARMVWCDEALVVDRVPLARLSRRWAMQRALSSGNASALVSVRLADGAVDQARVRCCCTLLGLLRVLGGGGRALAGWLLRRRTHEARGVRTALRGAGMTLGAWGVAYHEYRRPGSVVSAPRGDVGVPVGAHAE